MERALGIRILDPFLENSGDHMRARLPDDTSDVVHALNVLSEKKKPSCFILCVDEVHKVHEASNALLQGLFNTMGKLSCSRDHFVIPVMAGTVIRPIEEILHKSTHPPLRIPLPLLSYESTFRIIRESLKLDEAAYEEVYLSLKQLVTDIGGHPRALEILFDTLKSYDPVQYLQDGVDAVLFMVQGKINERYALEELNKIIAVAFLSKEVLPNALVSGTNCLTYQDFEERGVAKLKSIRLKAECHVQVPYIFVSTALTFRDLRPNSAGRFWKQLLLDQPFRWQDWEEFNRNYFAFRLSLYSYIGEDATLSLRSYFKGAKFNLTSDIHFVVPPVSTITVKRANARFPMSLDKSFESYEFVLNAPGAPFDAFVYLDTPLPNKRFLLVFQMKFSDSETKRPAQVNSEMLEKEYKKVQNSVAKFREGTEFVLVFPIHRRKAVGFTDMDVPPNCVVIAKEEQEAVYGELYHHRLDRF